MYKVYEVAKILNVSHTTIYRALRKGEKEVSAELVCVIDGCKFVTDSGLSYLRSVYPNSDFSKDSEPKSSQNQSSIVSSLLKQLEQKDIQLAEKDLQISQLIEQARNYQILLKTQQDKFLMIEDKKPNFLVRLFGRKSV